jgi:hypothetical protein
MSRVDTDGRDPVEIARVVLALVRWGVGGRP